MRDILRSPVNILETEGVSKGMTVLDFGCGPGGFALAAARITGPGGLVYAVDIHPLALDAIRRKAPKAGGGNLRAIHADGMDAIPAESVDIALLYDVLHDLDSPVAALSELCRVMKREAVLSVRDHCLDTKTLLSIVTGEGCFEHSGGVGRISRFTKIIPEGGGR